MSKKRKATILAAILAVFVVVGGVIFALTRDGDEAPSSTPTNTKYEVLIGEESPTADNVTVYFDYYCHWCQLLEGALADDFAQAVENGEINLRLAPANVLYGAVPSGRDALASFYYIADKEPEKVFDYHRALFSYIKLKKSSPVTLEELQRVATEVGVSEAVVEGMRDGLEPQRVEDALKAFLDKGHKGTPTLVINDKVIEDWVNKNLEQLRNEAR